MFMAGLVVTRKVNAKTQSFKDAKVDLFSLCLRDRYISNPFAYNAKISIENATVQCRISPSQILPFR